MNSDSYLMRLSRLSRTAAAWLFLGNLAYAAGPSWVQAVRAGGSGSDVGNAVKTDQSANRYVTGSFSSSTQFGPQTLVSQGGTDVFLAKYGSNGHLLWIVQMGGAGDDIGFDVGVGGVGNIYVTGKITDTTTFQSLNGPSRTVIGVGETIFLAKYSPTGTLLWVQTGITGVGNNEGFGLAVQPATGTIFVTGRAQGQITFSSADGTQHSVAGPWFWHMYLVKYDSNGNFQWGEWNQAAPNSVGQDVAVDSTGNAYITGWFESLATFHSADGNDVTITGFSGPVQTAPDYPDDAFVVKYDSKGNVKWVNDIGGYLAQGKAIAVSPKGKISLTGLLGNINGTPAQAMTIVTSQPGGTNVNLGGGKLTSPYNKDVVIATYNTSGVLLNATRLGTPQDEAGSGIVYDNKENLYVAGVFQGGLDIPDHSLVGTKPYNLFVLKEVPSGWVAWAKKADGAGTNAFADSPRIAVKSEDTVLVTGAFQNTAVFGGLTLNSAGAEDVFLAELQGGPCAFSFFPLTTILSNGTTFSMSPNGVNDFGAVVGTGFTNTTPVQNFGFIRQPNGSIQLVKGVTALVDRNDLKVSIGYNSSGQVLVDSSGTITPLQLSFNNNGFFSRGINNWGNIVGSYNTSTATNGFKRFSNGGTVKLGFPGASSTFPTSINDHGMIVGSYFVGSGGGQLPQNGFIYSQGNWATLNYPGSLFTDLVGVSNNGVIVGNATDLDLAFRYENGNFKPIVGPNGVGVTVTGISSRFGLLVGTAGPKGGFIATCQ